MPDHRRPALAPVVPDLRAVLRRVAYCLALLNLGGGTTYLFGGPAGAPSLRVLLDVIPLPAWAAALATAGLLGAVAPRLRRLEQRAYVVAYLLGTLAWGGYAVSSWVSLFDGTLLGATGPWTTTGLALLHLNALHWRNLDRLAGR